MKRKSGRDDIKLILFDLGGVVIQPSGLKTMIEWSGKSIEELWLAWLESESVRAFESGKIGKDEFNIRVIEEFSLNVTPSQFMEEFEKWANTPYPGAFELLKNLSEIYVTASLSNTNEVHWKILTENLRIDSLFHHNYPSHITGLIKPDREPFINVAQSLGLDFMEILFLDDNFPNVKTALDLGMNAHQVKGAGEVKEVLVKEGLL